MINSFTDYCNGRSADRPFYPTIHPESATGADHNDELRYFKEQGNPQELLRVFGTDIDTMAYASLGKAHKHPAGRY